MEIIAVKIKQEWNGAPGENKPFTQSWEWGDILIAEGKEVERLEVKEGETVVAAAQIVYMDLPLGWKYAFCPKGVVTGNYEIMKLKEIYSAFLAYIKETKSVFFRVEPQSINFPISQFPNFKKTININPPATLILDLTKSNAELLAGMHPKTRYNIGLAERKGVTVREEKNFEIFWRLMRETAERDGFKLHGRKHYEKALESPLASQFIADYNGQDIACAVCVGYGKIFTYLYGASDNEHRNLMAPYLLQWKAICFAKERGYEKYDFFGVAPRLRSALDDNYPYDTKHQYAGVTRFKLGFGGEPFQTVGTRDIIINKKKYHLYNLLRMLRRML